MNATYNIDHLQAITHVTSLLNSTTAPGNTAIIKPKSAATSHYDPSGKQVATVSNTSYEGVNFAADGTISGGNLTHQSNAPDGTQLSTTAIGFQSNGRPASAQIDVNNISGSGNFKQVQMDMSDVSWNNSFAISSGQVKMTTIDGSTQQKKNDGVIQFNNETVASGAITHYDPDNDGVVAGYSEVDYSGAKFLGANIVGGQYSVKSLTAAKALSSSSQINLSTVGQLQSIATTNMDPETAAVSTKVAVDFSKVAFNARNEFDSGEINYTANDNQGALLSQTAVTYNNTFPALSTTSVYDKGQLQNKIEVDYSGAQFNNDRQVVNSTKKVNIYSGNGKLISSSVIAYDKHGKKLKDDDPEAIKIKATKPVQSAKATTPVTPVKFVPPVKSANDPDITEKTDPTTRPDGTLEKTVVTTSKKGTAISALITLYAADGKTVVKTFTMDLTGLAYDSTKNTVTGALNMQMLLGGNTLNSESTVQY